MTFRWIFLWDVGIEGIYFAIIGSGCWTRVGYGVWMCSEVYRGDYFYSGYPGGYFN